MKSAGITSTTEAGTVRDEHRFDVAALSAYLENAVPEFTPPATVAQVQGGMSNPTFLLTDGAGVRSVLRKKPPGQLLPSAHAVDREYRVMAALATTDVPVPNVLVLCEDESVIGQAFYVMAFLGGRVFRRLDLPELPPEARGAIYDAMNEALVALHAVDPAAVGLGDYGRPDGYVARQIARWSKQYEASRTENLPAMEELMSWLPANLPPEGPVTLAHGDFRLENLIFHPAEPRILGVVDWELSTLGDPLADLAYNCLPYHVADPRRGTLIGNDPAMSGITNEQHYVNAYVRRSGRQVSSTQWVFYLALALFRLAAICQGVYKRGLMGNAVSPDALKRRDMARELSQVAVRLVEKDHMTSGL